jgi:hypothetical protein
MKIYVICYTEDVGCLSDQYVTTKEGIKQLVIDHYWGKLTEPPPGRLTVTLDMTLNIAIVKDGLKADIVYNILEFERKSHVA